TLPVGKIQREIASGQWDLLRLKTLAENALITINYVLTQQRSQRMMIVEQTSRFVCVWLVFWNIISHGFYQPSVLVAILLIALSFVLEPRWRLRMLNAVGVACGVHFSDYNAGLLATVPVILVTRFGELIIIYAALALTAGLGSLGIITMIVIIP